jgi:hypothetical protein
MKLPYFSLKNALNDARYSFAHGSAGDKLASTAKLLGKTVANCGMLATEAGAHVVKMAPEIAGNAAKKSLDENSDLMSEEKKEKAREMIKAGNAAREKRLATERHENMRKDEEA